MKRLALLIFFIVIARGNAHAQPVQAHLKVTRLNTTKRTLSILETSFGTYDRDYSRSMGISIVARGMGARAPAVLEWYFIAKDLNSSRYWVYDSGKTDIALDPANALKLEKYSKELSSSVQNWTLMEKKVKTGSRIDGYIVRIVAEEQVIAVAASSRPFEVIGKSETDMAQLVSEKQPGTNQ